MTLQNRPGQGALAYRVGTYGTFLRAMLERANVALPTLKARTADDASIALLDGWALIADVLSFYQERIANEGFLRTAKEKRSLLEFARLVGYAPRPGVAASVFLAYTLEKGGDVTLAPGNRAQSIPGPGETAQTFETADALVARDTWNALGLRKTHPQDPKSIEPFYLSTVTTNLKPNDVVLFVRTGDVPPAGAPPDIFRVAAVELQPTLNRTKIIPYVDVPAPIGAALASQPAALATATDATLLERIARVEGPLLAAPSVTPRSPQRLERGPGDTLGPNLDLTTQLFGALHPSAAESIYAALASAPAAATSPVEVYAFRVHAAPYGHNAPSQPVVGDRFESRGFDLQEWTLADLDRDPQVLSLDARYDRVVRGSYVAVRTFAATKTNVGTTFANTFALFRAADIGERARRDYGIAATTTVLKLDAPFFTTDPVPDETTLVALRNVDVFAQSERLQLADVPIESAFPDDPTAGPTVLELDGVYDGLTPGRWGIVAGTRADVAGVEDAELVMIAATEHRTNPQVPGDTLHTFVKLSSQLAFRYVRESVRVFGNVVRATHGESRGEALGSGDASLARQSFALKAKPLTFVSSPTQSGTQSSLSVRVNGVRWNASDDPSALAPTDRAYVTATSDAGTVVTFGDGIHGARLPRGTENVIATYRTGLGSAGNVAAGKIALLQSRPLGVKDVVNPKSASGGADSESRHELRRNIPTALLALDRLVSLDDYEHFARTFAGIAKATVTRLGTGGSSTVVITLAGPDNAAIDEHGDLVANLEAAFRTLGDPRQAFEIRSCDRVVLFIGASIDLVADALWETVEPAIRAALSRAFGFDNGDFAKPAYKSVAFAAIQNVDGVRDVTIDLFTGITNDTLADVAGFRANPKVQDAVVPQPTRRLGERIAPAELVALDPTVHDTVVLRRNSGEASR